MRLTVPDVGGGFGMKNFVYPEWALVLWAARRLKRPVRWASERIEDFVSSTHGRDNVSRGRLALGRSYGFGMVWRSPIGLLRADYAFPLVGPPRFVFGAGP